MNNQEIIVASCQKLALQWLDTASLGGYALIVSIAVAVILKVFAVIYMTGQLKGEYQKNSKASLPKWIKNIANQNNFPLEKIIIDQKNRHESAFTLGFYSPIIIINKKMLKNYTKKQTEAIVLHEIYHSKKFHALAIAVTNLISETLFFLPIIKGMATQFANFCEQSADKFVITRQKTNQHLLGALKNTLLDQKDAEFRFAHIAIANFATKNVENRITAIKEKKFVLGFPDLKQHLATIAIVSIFGVLIVSGQKIEASVSMLPNTTDEKISESCNIWQCASSCFASNTKTELFTPNKNQSEL